MTCGELIEILKKYPSDATVYRGMGYPPMPEGHGLDIYELYDDMFEDIKYYEKVRSCRSSLPSVNSIYENVLIFAE